MHAELVIISPKLRWIMTGNKIGETLKELRNYSGMTQEAISRELNISRQTYSYYETGSRIPDLEMACRLAAYYHITLDQLVLTGLHPSGRDPFASLPDGYRELLRKYHDLPIDRQRTIMAFLDFLSRDID